MTRTVPCALFLLFTACARHESEKEDKRESTHAAVNTPPPPPPPSPAKHAVLDYAATATCAARELRIVFPEHNRELLGARGCSPITLGGVDTTSCDGADAGTYCVAATTFNGQSHGVWLVKNAGGFLVDYRATELAQPTFVSLKAQMPTKPVVVRAFAMLSDYYNYEFGGKHATHYAFELSDPQQTVMSTRVYAYIAKTAPDAQTLFDVTKDGKWHPVTVAIAYPKTKESSQVCVLSSLVSPSFLESEAEHAFEAPSGPTR